MQLRELCEHCGLSPETHTKSHLHGLTDYTVAKRLHTNAVLSYARSGHTCLTLETCQVALSGTKVLSMEERLDIVAALNYDRKRAPVTIYDIDWAEAPDTRTSAEKARDYQHERQSYGEQKRAEAVRKLDPAIRVRLMYGE